MSPSPSRAAAPRRRSWRAAVGGLLVLLVASGCGGAVGRVTLSKGFLFESTTVPLMFERPRDPDAPIVIPPDLLRVEVAAHKIDLSPPGIPFARGWSFGWGDVSNERLLEESGLDTIVFADGKYFSVLNGVYERATIIAYGRPKGTAPPERDGARPEGAGDGPAQDTPAARQAASNSASR